jgi:nitrite reductase/ring-hydroxylating ferredoxin subunit
MVYRYGTTVNRQAWIEGATAFTPICPASSLLGGQLRQAKVGGVDVLLTRVNGQIFAIGDSCTHWGCSLAQGELNGRKITCRCHGSTFDLADGSVVNGPATAPEPTFEIRERNGQVEVRMLPY